LPRGVPNAGFYVREDGKVRKKGPKCGTGESEKREGRNCLWGGTY